MPKLSTVESLRDRLSLVSMAPINEALDVALTSATPQIAAYLNTELIRKSYVDFYTMERRTQKYVGDHVAAHLSNGFVVPDTVKYSYAGDSSALNCNLGDTPLANVKLGEGLFFITDNSVYRYARDSVLYMRVSYTAGFAEDSSGVLQDVPYWLKELAEVWAGELYAGKCPKDDKPHTGCNCKATELGANRVRFFPNTFHPVP